MPEGWGTAMLCFRRCWGELRGLCLKEDLAETPPGVARWLLAPPALRSDCAKEPSGAAAAPASAAAAAEALGFASAKAKMAWEGVSSRLCTPRPASAHAGSAGGGSRSEVSAMTCPKGSLKRSKSTSPPSRTRTPMCAREPLQSISKRVFHWTVRDPSPDMPTSCVRRVTVADRASPERVTSAYHLELGACNASADRPSPAKTVTSRMPRRSSRWRATQPRT
mmetsp:Transcript_1394/g.4443  ORF Transcript_1394/g.4443 Transcript_1394/m.4443 type:complete len:222 (+) Transcript_1394:303-968(+)